MQTENCSAEKEERLRGPREFCSMEAEDSNPIGCTGAGAKTRYVWKQAWKKEPVLGAAGGER